MTKHKTHLLAFFTLILLVVGTLSACSEDEAPPVVYVTPTGGPVETPAITPAPVTSPGGDAATPGAPFGSVAAVGTAAPATAQDTATTAAPTQPPATPVPGEDFGAIVGPGYVLTPTATHLPPSPAPTHVVPVTPVPGENFGAIVGPGYVLPPTETRVAPTEAPTTVPTAGPSPTPYPGLNASLVGVQIHANISSDDFNRVLAHAHTLKVTWIKMQFNWSLLEFSPGVFTDLFYGMRRYVQQAHDDGFEVLVSVAKAPGWSRTVDADGQMRENGPPDDPQVLATFMTALLTMTGFDASGQPYIDAIEVWNEPNLMREWYGHPMTGEHYMRYFAPAYSAIRAFSSSITIITAGPAPTGDSTESTNDRKWIQQLYNAGLASYGADVQVGIHPYGWANAPDATCCTSPSRGWDDQPQFFFLDTIDDYRQIMLNNGHATQMWSTEFGWPTFDGLTPASGGPTPAPPQDEIYFGYINQWQQADYTMRAFELAQQRDYLGPMFLWNLNFSTIPNAIDSGDKKTGYSLLTGQWQPRPVYLALQRALAR